MSYYKNFDTIGLISLNDWYVIDFPLKNYDENGNEIESAASTSFLSGNTGEIAYSSDGTPSRGMASIDVTLPINYEVDTNMLEKHLCQNCLNKVAASLEYRKSNSERKEAISLCILFHLPRYALLTLTFHCALLISKHWKFTHYMITGDHILSEIIM